MFSLLVDIFGFLSVILRGFILTTQSFTLGGVAFLALVALPFREQLGHTSDIILSKSIGFLRGSAISLMVVMLLALGINCSVLIGTLDLSLVDALTANFAKTEMLVALCALTMTLMVNKTSIQKTAPVLIALACLILLAQVSVTHAASRLHMQIPLMIADFLHMLGAAVWIGGLPYFLIALNAISDGQGWRLVGRRYSLMSMTSVGMIIVGGLFMAVIYIGSVEAAYGTAYGVMTMTKVALLGGLLCLGGMNYKTVEAMRKNPATPVLRMKRFAEVEIGLGLTVLFAAASLTSLPPGDDLINDRVTIPEIVGRLAPQWPIRLESPDHDALAIPMLENKIAQAKTQNTNAPLAFIPGEGLPPPRNAADIAWSEYNHHWAGIFVLMIGLLALLEKAPWGRWARHWPALFLVMGAFLFIRSDPEVWPLGDIGFFASLRDPEVVQHRFFVLMIILFGIFEWRVRTGRIKNPNAALVFPLITALGGMMLLTHSHAIANLKEQLLIEMSHVPLALAGITAGWARWLEIRMDGKVSAYASWVWPIAFVLVGLILLSYREA